MTRNLVLEMQDLEVRLNEEMRRFDVFIRPLFECHSEAKPNTQSKDFKLWQKTQIELNAMNAKGWDEVTKLLIKRRDLRLSIERQNNPLYPLTPMDAK